MKTAEEILELHFGSDFWELEDNGFLIHILKAMTEYAVQDKWISVKDSLPEIGGEYNVIYDLQDGGEPLATTMEFDFINKEWVDIIGANITIHTVTHWQSLPKPIGNK